MLQIYSNEIYFNFASFFFSTFAALYFFPSGPEVESRIWWIFHPSATGGWLIFVAMEMHKLFVEMPLGSRIIITLSCSRYYCSIWLCGCVVSSVFEIWFASVLNVLWNAVLLDLTFLSRIEWFCSGRNGLLLTLLSFLQWFKSCWRCFTGASHVLFLVLLHSCEI